MEGPIETSPDASGRNANDVPVTYTPVTPTTPIVTEAETTEEEMTSPRTFPPTGLLQDLLLQPPVAQEHGYNVFPNDK